jgi:hypothetical protein
MPVVVVVVGGVLAGRGAAVLLEDGPGDLDALGAALLLHEELVDG